MNVPVFVSFICFVLVSSKYTRLLNLLQALTLLTKLKVNCLYENLTAIKYLNEQFRIHYDVRFKNIDFRRSN